LCQTDLIRIECRWIYTNLGFQNRLGNRKRTDARILFRGAILRECSSRGFETLRSVPWVPHPRFLRVGASAAFWKYSSNAWGHGLHAATKWRRGWDSNPAAVLHPRKLQILNDAGVATTAGIAVVGYSLGTDSFARLTTFSEAGRAAGYTGQNVPKCSTQAQHDHTVRSV
jgi:hypothetical protein